MFKILKAACAAAALLTALSAVAQVTQLPLASPLAMTFNAQWLDSMCRTAQVETNPKDVRFSSDILCKHSMSAVWQTAVATAEITGVPLVCTTVPVQEEVLEIVFLAYGQKLARTDFAAFTAAGSAGKVALAAFMQAYPCK
jgi:hypothetical protein